MTASGAWHPSNRSSRRTVGLVAAALAALFSVVALPLGIGPAHAAGPWKGQIVDAETGQPLSGVVILAAWWLRSPGVVHERREFHEAHEVVTDSDGRFVVPAVTTLTLNPFARIQGPDLKIFKGGYGQWQFRGEPPILASDVIERNAWLEQAWQRFEGEGVVIELPPLKTREERLKRLHSPDPGVPLSRAQQYLQAVNAERHALGLGTIR